MFKQVDCHANFFLLTAKSNVKCQFYCLSKTQIEILTVPLGWVYTMKPR